MHPAPAPDVSPLLEGLTDPQREAVMATEGPLLVIAAAGSGKTRVITRRIAYLVHMGIPPWQILAVTFTNKAAAEMRNRVTSILPPHLPGLRGLTVTTFHSLCARLLRTYVDVLQVPGLNSSYSIFDSADQLSVMKSVLKRLDLSASNFPPRSLLARISGLKNRLITAEQASGQSADFFSRQIARAYLAYDDELRKNNGVDFDDLLMLTARLLREHPDVAAEVQERYQYLLIDEYQDTNHAQLRIATALADARRNICVVGDPDQSIYAWRGADITNILEFEDQYPDATVVALGQNFRSTTFILQAADHLIRFNQQRKHKDLFTTREGGETPQVILCADAEHEADVVIDYFRRLREEDDRLQWKDMAVFYRTNALSRVLEEALLKSGIPYVVARGTAFYQRKEVRDALAYLRLIANPVDEISLRRVINTPARGISKATVERVERFAIHARSSFYDALVRVEENDALTARAGAAVKRFTSMVESWRRAGERPIDPEDPQATAEMLRDLVADVIKSSGLEAYYRKSAVTEEDAQRLENLSELVSSAAAFAEDWLGREPEVVDASDEAVGEGEPADASTLYDVLFAWLEQVSLVADVDNLDPDIGAVSLMTLHAAKGLEFPAVAIIGLEEGLLPHSRSRESERELEEERRLCFVGITRAMEHLLITCARKRSVRGFTERTIMSQFLGELPEDIVSFSDQSEHRLEYEDVGDPLYDEDEYGSIPMGCRVRHPQFGPGRVHAVLPGGYVKVKFDQAGLKTLALTYARLERID
jgi:DNA helicase-2/ATP-dependent DNA helicase PcrA